MSLFANVVSDIVDDYDLIGLVLNVKFDPRSISWHGSMWCRWAAESNMADMTSVFSRVTQGTVKANPWHGLKMKKHFLEIEMIEMRTSTDDAIKARELLNSVPDIFCKGYNVSIDGKTYPDILHRQEQEILFEKLHDHRSIQAFNQVEYYYDTETQRSDKAFTDKFDVLVSGRAKNLQCAKKTKLHCHYSRLAYEMLR